MCFLFCSSGQNYTHCVTLRCQCLEYTQFSSEVLAGLRLTSHTSLSVLINDYAAFWGPAVLAILLRRKKEKGSWLKSARTELFLLTPWSMQVTKGLAHLVQGASWWLVIAASPQFLLLSSRGSILEEPVLRADPVTWTKRASLWFRVNPGKRVVPHQVAFRVDGGSTF